MSNVNAILNCSAVHKSFWDGNAKIEVLNAINLNIKPGEQVAIVGASGSGKSTLLHIVGGLDKPTTGQVYIQNKDIHQLAEKERCQLRNKALGFIYQFHHLLPEFTALENVCMPLLLGNMSAKLAREKAALLLAKVGLAKRMHHRMGELSGGERQRTAIARALVTQPLCVLADEPTGNLDNKTAAKVYDVMQELNKEFNTSLLVVTHDLQLAKRMDRILTIENGYLETFV